MRKLILAFFLTIIVLAACAPKTDETERQRAIAQSVSATLAAIPTYTPYPTYPPRARP